MSLFTRLTVLLGGTMQMAGWFMLFMGSLFAWLFVGSSEVVFLFENEKNWLKAPGVVLSSEPSNASEHNEKIFEVLATFEVDEETYISKGYTKGYRFSGGEKVVVEYEGINPDVSKIKGLRRAAFDKWVLFVLIFPFGGLMFIGITFWKNIRAVRLLINGVFTRGEIKTKEETNSRVNERMVYKYQFKFTVGGKEEIAKCKTHLTALIEDEEKEIILYDPFNPSYNIVYDLAPMPEITTQGNLAPAGSNKLGLFFLPLLTVGLNLYLFTNGLPFSL